MLRNSQESYCLMTQLSHNLIILRKFRKLLFFYIYIVLLPNCPIIFSPQFSFSSFAQVPWAPSNRMVPSLIRFNRNVMARHREGAKDRATDGSNKKGVQLNDRGMVQQLLTGDEPFTVLCTWSSLNWLWIWQSMYDHEFEAGIFWISFLVYISSLLCYVKLENWRAAANLRQRTGSTYSTINSNWRRRTDRLKQIESDEVEGKKILVRESEQMWVWYRDKSDHSFEFSPRKITQYTRTSLKSAQMIVWIPRNDIIIL